MKPQCNDPDYVLKYILIAHFYALVFVGLPTFIVFKATWSVGFAGGFSAFVAALAMYALVEGSRQDNCSSEGVDSACLAGVIVAIVPSFNSGWDFLFPWNTSHDRIDIVVKSVYWPLLEDPPDVVGVHCNGDRLSSPLMHCFYFSSEVCGAGLGASIGAGAGAIAGIIAGILIAAAIGCATVFLCLFALILAALVAALLVLAGAFAGGQIGKALAPKSTFQSQAANGHIGTYITVSGNVNGLEDVGGGRKEYQKQLGPFRSIKVMFFVKQTSVHGVSMNLEPYGYDDPDTYLVNDACARQVPGKIK
jgi:hypothetical protein